MGEGELKLCANCKYGAGYNEICNACLSGVIDDPNNFRDAYWEPRKGQPKEITVFAFTPGISNKKEDN